MATHTHPTYTPRPITAADVKAHEAHGSKPSQDCRLCRAIFSVV